VPSAAERAAAGEQLVTSMANLTVRHEPRHLSQVEGWITSLCNQTAVWVVPDAPALRGRGPLPLCPQCASRIRRRQKAER
jgi:hypothetical protein